MTRHTVRKVQLVDDLDGSKAGRTVPFEWDGTAYEIELSAKNEKAFRQAIRPYAEAGRRVARRRKPRK